LCGGQDLRRPDGTPWVCTYDDEFDGSSLDTRYWIPQVSATSGLFTGTTDQPACFINDPSTIDEHDGDLDLNADSLDAPVSCGSKSSSLVSGMVAHTGTFEQTYGRFEVRARLPAWTGSGLQETFWLWPDDQLKYGLFHPSSGEIDFSEFYSDYSTLDIPVVHYLFDPSTISYATNTNIYTSYTCTIPVGKYNTYALEWYPGRIVVSINGKVCITDDYIATNAPAGSPYAPFDSPFFLALTQAFGTTGNVFDATQGPKTSTTSVDYVRVWE
jgi:beta-glucanase (GH16 family)